MDTVEPVQPAGQTRQTRALEEPYCTGPVLTATGLRNQCNNPTRFAETMDVSCTYAEEIQTEQRLPHPRT
jgi:hypothetical protein